MSMMVDLGACLRKIGYQVEYCVQYRESSGDAKASDASVSFIVETGEDKDKVSYVCVESCVEEEERS